MAVAKIHSQRVILVEGFADEFVPNVEPATGMQGFAILVPPGERGERLMDMLWRITMAYAGMPRLLTSRATVRKMVEAVMSKKSRGSEPVRHPAPKTSKADRASADQMSLSSPLVGAISSRNAKPRRAMASSPSQRGQCKAESRK